MRHIKNLQWTFRRGMAVSLFLLTLLVILLLFPNVKQFRFSYQTGKPWQYETLYAPFQFPVKKTEQQIAREKEALLKEAIPYYNFSKDVGKNQIAEARKDSLLSAKSLLFLQNMYAEPIWAEDSVAEENTKIFIVKEHISTQMELDELRTVSSVMALISKSSFALSQKIQLKKYVQSNLVFNAEQTAALNQTNNVSIYLGEVQSNELIISKGEVVTSETYRVLESLRSEYSGRVEQSSNVGSLISGQFLFVALCLLFIYLFLRNYRKDILQKPLYMSFILLSVVVSVALTRIMLNFGELDIYLVPYTLFAVIIRTFIDSRTALFTYSATMIICSFIVPQGYEFLTVQLVTGIVAVLFLKHLERRSQLLLTAFIVFICYAIMYVAVFTTGEGKLENMDMMVFVRFFLNAIFLTVAYPLLYLLEKTFGFLSNVTLIELSNTNNKLLRELSQEAPGTFQHSMQMANLAEDAVRELGGNPLLVRTGALYHDIGKMEEPMYFTENQHGEVSPHLEMAYEESAKVIIGHVTAGIRMAKKYKLPSQLVDFIETHHGKGRTEYFYRSFVNENPEKDVAEADFTYPGPDPFTLEQAVLMMADACEAATRSLKRKTESNIQKMVSDVVDFQKNDGRFNNAPITFKDIEMVKMVFVRKLTNIYHSRIAYPEKNTAEE